MTMEPIAAPSTELSFWQETKPELIPTLKAEALAIGVVALLLAGVYFILSMSFDMDSIKNNPNIFKEHPELLINGAGYGFVWCSIYAVAIYTFCTLYLRRAVKTSPPQLSLGNFFYWLGKSVQKGLALVLPLLFFTIAVIGIVVVAKLQGAFAVLFGLIEFAGFCYYIHAAFRMCLVTPIAILRRKAVLKNSWTITQGYCWRIFTGGFMLALVMFLVFLVPSILVAVLSAISPKSVITIALSSLIHGAFYSAMIMCSVVYNCTVYRVLLRQKKAA